MTSSSEVTDVEQRTVIAGLAYSVAVMFAAILLLVLGHWAMALMVVGGGTAFACCVGVVWVYRNKIHG